MAPRRDLPRGLRLVPHVPIHGCQSCRCAAKRWRAVGVLSNSCWGGHRGNDFGRGGGGTEGREGRPSKQTGGGRAPAPAEDHKGVVVRRGSSHQRGSGLAPRRAMRTTNHGRECPPRGLLRPCPLPPALATRPRCFPPSRPVGPRAPARCQAAGNANLPPRLLPLPTPTPTPPPTPVPPTAPPSHTRCAREWVPRCQKKAKKKRTL